MVNRSFAIEYHVIYAASEYATAGATSYCALHAMSYYIIIIIALRMKYPLLRYLAVVPVTRSTIKKNHAY